jgi:NAD(P)-dependent dehydrogenase (short-subunit alcohol dehydrogenase family)
LDYFSQLTIFVPYNHIMSKVILITGGSSGIGKAVGEYLHQKKYTVYGTSRNPSNYQGSTSFPLLALDVTQPETIHRAVHDVMEREGRIDVVINNAGVGITGPVEETPMDEIKKAFDTNLYGPLEVIKAVLPYMRKEKKGLIINVTSIAGYMGLPYRAIYSASKGALELVTEAYRMEIAPFGIGMTTIAPGDFATNIAAGRYHAPVIPDSPYKLPYSNTLKMMNEHVDHGSDPIEMAKVIQRIIETPNPNVRYKVGSFIQKISVFLKNNLPGRTYEKMLMKHYKLK